MTTSALAGAAAAMASFELMYLPDAASGKITRYDPINKIVLGSFGYPDSTSAFASVAAGEMPGSRAYLTGQIGTRVADPNTGVIFDAYSAPYYPGRCSASGNYLFSHTGTSSSSRYDVTAFNNGAIATSMTIMDTMPLSDTIAWNFGVDVSGNFAMQRVDFGASTAGTMFTVVAASVMGGSTTRIGMATRYVNSVGTIRYAIPIPTAANALQILHITMNAAETGYTNTSQINLSGFATGSAVSTLASHDGFFVIGDDASSATTTRVEHFDSQFYSYGSYTTTAFNVPTSRWGGVNVMAPEPGMWAMAAFAGLAFGLRRRRRG